MTSTSLNIGYKTHSNIKTSAEILNIHRQKRDTIRDRGVAESWMTVLLQIYCWVWTVKNFENQSIFGVGQGILLVDKAWARDDSIRFWDGYCSGRGYRIILFHFSNNCWSSGIGFRLTAHRSDFSYPHNHSTPLHFISTAGIPPISIKYRPTKM